MLEGIAPDLACEPRTKRFLRGDLHVEGESLADCTDPVTVARVNRFRDCVVRVRDFAPTP